MLNCLMGCTNKQVVTEVQIVKVQPPVITPCSRYSIKACKPATNGELFECVLKITQQLDLCADQTDALIKWSKQVDSQ